MMVVVVADLIIEFDGLLQFLVLGVWQSSLFKEEPFELLILFLGD